MKSKKWTFSIITVVIISILSIFLLGFKLTINKTPSEVYAIYLEGKKIGVVKSKEEFDEYINVQEEKLKIQNTVRSIKSIYLNPRYFDKIDFKPYFSSKY